MCSRVPTADDETIVFVSEAIENIPPGYRARETYTIVSRDEFTERFDIAEPGKDFELYSEGRLKLSASVVYHLLVQLLRHARRLDSRRKSRSRSSRPARRHRRRR